MSNRRSLKEIIHKRTIKNNRNLSLLKLSAYVALYLGIVVLFFMVLVLIFGDAFLNGYGKIKVERAFGKAYPGYVLQIGKLGYTVGANRLVTQSITLSSSNSTLKVGRISLTGVRWLWLLCETATLSDVFANASLDAMKFDMKFPNSNTGLRCARLRTSVPDSELMAEDIEIKPLVGDEELFAASAFRVTRIHMVIPEFRVSGLMYGELLQGKSCQARSVNISRPYFDALINRDKPVEPFVKSSLMIHEALAAILQPLQLDSLNITNGYLKYSERVIAKSDPGVLTFAAVNMSVLGIANRGEASAAILLRAQGVLMNAGLLKVLMTIPVNSTDFTLHYSGSLSAMDMTRLNAFLEIAEQTRIKSGIVQEAAFEIDVAASQAHGRMHLIYKNLEIAILDNKTGTEAGLDNQIVSFLANLVKIRKSNVPDASGSMKEGEINYTRRPEDGFLKFVWFALRSGVLNVINY
jgi:hypothetical protein